MKFFAYFGSKTWMLDDIYRVINQVRGKITCFVDVFGGSGAVALNLPFKPNVVVYNDLDEYLYKTFKVIQDDELRKKLLEKLETAFSHRKVFEDFKEDYFNNKKLDDVETAFRVIYLCQSSYSGGMESFKVIIKERRNSLEQSINPIKNFGNVIKNWIIENLDFREVIEKYDSPTTFFYLDPPYLTSGTNYKFGDWGIGSFKDLKKLCDNMQGMWLMNESEVDFEEIIKIFGQPKFTKQCVSHVVNSREIGGEKSSRLEGFWFDLKGNEKNIKSFLYRKI